MKVAYISSTYFADVDFCFLRELSKKRMLYMFYCTTEMTMRQFVILIIAITKQVCLKLIFILRLINTKNL